jgi:hypothetical protein
LDLGAQRRRWARARCDVPGVRAVVTASPLGRGRRRRPRRIPCAGFPWRLTWHPSVAYIVPCVYSIPSSRRIKWNNDTFLNRSITIFIVVRI